MTLQKRHTEANKKLSKAARIYFSKQTTDIITYRKIGKKLNISDRTVKNYVDGYGKDGFLTEAITDEFELLINP